MAEKETKTAKKRKDAEWLDLCEWVEREIFKYDKLTHLKTQAALVLKGLQHGKAMANNTTRAYGDYPFIVIKMTFMANKNVILDAIRNKDFQGSEASKMRYVCAIVRDKIDDVYMRYMNSQKSEEKIEIMNTDIIEYQGAEYQSKVDIATTKKFDDKFKELW